MSLTQHWDLKTARSLSNGSSNEFEDKITINATTDKVLAAYEDVAGWPDRDTDVLSSQLDGPLEPGSEGKLKPKQGPETNRR